MEKGLPKNTLIIKKEGTKLMLSENFESKFELFGVIEWLLDYKEDLKKKLKNNNFEVFKEK